MARFVYGIHPVTALLTSGEDLPQVLLVKAGEQGPAIQRVVALARAAHVKMREATADELHRLCKGGNHQGVVARVADFAYRDLDEWLREAPAKGLPDLVVLDGVQDPHNVGAVLRSADAFGAGAVILPKDNGCGVTEAAARSAAGAAEAVDVMQVVNLSRALDALKDAGYWIYGTEAKASQRLYEADLRGPAAFVFGSEGEGMRRLVRERCDFLLALPCVGRVSSLNISVSVGVVLSEAFRQKHPA